jgi:hypothetical protein
MAKKWNYVQIGAIWNKEDQETGETYMSGLAGKKTKDKTIRLFMVDDEGNNLGEVTKLAFMKNQYKEEGDSKPDIIISAMMPNE